MKKRGKDLSKLKAIVDKLSNDEPLDVSLRDHKLTGNLSMFRECHIEPNWLLIYQKSECIDKNSDGQDNDGENVIKLLCLEQTGSHSDLFE